MLKNIFRRPMPGGFPMADSEKTVATLQVIAHGECLSVLCGWDVTAPQSVIAEASKALLDAVIGSAMKALREKGLPLETIREVILDVVSSPPKAFFEASSGVPGDGECPPEETGL
jgi:hypothetical protein